NTSSASGSAACWAQTRAAASPWAMTASSRPGSISPPARRCLSTARPSRRTPSRGAAAWSSGATPPPVRWRRYPTPAWLHSTPHCTPTDAPPLVGCDFLDDNRLRLPERPVLVDNEVDRHGDQDGDRQCPVELGAQAGGVIEDLGGQRDRRGRVHQQRGDHLTDHKGHQAGGQEGEE